MKRRFDRLVALAAAALVLIAAGCCTVRADELSDYSYEEVDDTVMEYGLSFKDVAKLVISGDFQTAFRAVGQALYNQVFGDYAVIKQTILKLVIVGIVGAVFKNMSSAFMESSISGTGTYIVQIALITIMTGGSVLAVSITKEVVEKLLEFMEALIPTYAIIVTAGSGSATAVSFYELVMFIIYMVDKLLLRVVVPCISIYMMVNMMNHLSKENSFSRLAELLADMIKWSNKTLLGIVISLNVIKGLISPMLDSVRQTSINKLLAMLPGVGTAVDAVAGVVLGSGALIKNTVGVTAMIFLFMLCFAPILKLFIFAYGCKAAAALLQPAAGKNYTDCINGMHEGLKMLLESVCNVLVLFLLTLAIVCASSNAAFYSGT